MTFGKHRDVEDPLLELIFQAYCEWQADCRNLRRCYASWSAATRGPEAAEAYDDCVAALDQEETSAQRLSARVARLARPEPQPVPLRELLERL